VEGNPISISPNYIKADAYQESHCGQDPTNNGANSVLQVTDGSLWILGNVLVDLTSAEKNSGTNIGVAAGAYDWPLKLDHMLR
jgi:hypothetical protein